VLTNEYVNPRWLLEHLGLPEDDRLFQGVAHSATGHLAQPPRVHSSFTFVQGRVCDGCNSGWMSRLETASMPVLKALVVQTRGLRSLSISEAALVGKWAIETAYLHTWKFTMHSLRHSFCSLLISSGVSPVYVQQQAGHAAVGFTVRVYGSWFPATAPGAMDRLANRVPGLPVARQALPVASAANASPEVLDPTGTTPRPCAGGPRTP
jgi:Phage integrase family